MDIYNAKYYGKGGEGEMASWGEKIRGLEKKEERKKGKNYTKKGEKALKMHLCDTKKIANSDTNHDCGVCIVFFFLWIRIRIFFVFFYMSDPD